MAGSYAPLESAGEYVCECLRDGERVSPKWGERAVHERVVRCRNCRALDQTDIDWRDWCFCRNFREYVEPSGFCAWGKMKED